MWNNSMIEFNEYKILKKFIKIATLNFFVVFSFLNALK